MEWFRYLPALNAALNATAATLLIIGFTYIRKRRIREHRRMMLSACGVSALFLVSYLTYHTVAGSTRFMGTGWARPLYFTILISHTILATAVLPLVIVTVLRGLRMDVAKHRRIARWTLPVWLYVSITGVIVYLMLYHIFPGR
ncbi:MAG TPA: DUF420 domain-containing protein [Thermoanaerobaculia bacterium]|nr:DUF420 domain-containing protein [Thermoanaerobaculia bacterium]